MKDRVLDPFLAVNLPAMAYSKKQYDDAVIVNCK
jgi:hypothetical protein